jgi:hypothetical protein
VLERPLRTIAIVLSLVVTVGFSLFAIEEMGQASDAVRNRLSGFEKADPTAAGERERERRNSVAREWVDDANDLLLKPFAGLVDSGDRWAQRGVPALLALMVYGFLLAYLARFMRGHG